MPNPTSLNPKATKEVEETILDGCPPRDDHASVFDENTATMYVFAGYVDGDKSNDIWSY